MGDSEAWLYRKGKPVRLMDCHKPLRKDEKKRIEESGGEVIMHVNRMNKKMKTARVNGILAVARAIGDVSLKKHVIGEPDISVTK